MWMCMVQIYTFRMARVPASIYNLLSQIKFLSSCPPAHWLIPSQSRSSVTASSPVHRNIIGGPKVPLPEYQRRKRSPFNYIDSAACITAVVYLQSKLANSTPSSKPPAQSSTLLQSWSVVRQSFGSSGVTALIQERLSSPHGKALPTSMFWLLARWSIRSTSGIASQRFMTLRLMRPQLRTL